MGIRLRIDLAMLFLVIAVTLTVANWNHVPPSRTAQECMERIEMFGPPQGLQPIEVRRGYGGEPTLDV